MLWCVSLRKFRERDLGPHFLVYLGRFPCVFGESETWTLPCACSLNCIDEHLHPTHVRRFMYVYLGPFEARAGLCLYEISLDLFMCF